MLPLRWTLRKSVTSRTPGAMLSLQVHHHQSIPTATGRFRPAHRWPLAMPRLAPAAGSWANRAGAPMLGSRADYAPHGSHGAPLPDGSTVGPPSTRKARS